MLSRIKRGNSYINFRERFQNKDSKDSKIVGIKEAFQYDENAISPLKYNNL